MALLPFALSDGTLNTEAAVQQADLIAAGYQLGFKAPTDLSPWIGSGQVLAAENALGRGVGFIDLTPAYVIVEQAGEMWIAIVGTQTTGQWISHATGFFFRTTLGSEPNSVNSLWYAMARQIHVRVWALQKQVEPKGVNISGHSLGGAVAWLLGVLVKQLTPEVPVRVMTFGAPRPAVGEYKGARPDVSFAVEIEGDEVTKLPPQDVLFSDPWRRQGTPLTLTADGVLKPGHADPETSVQALRSFDWALHWAVTYAAALRGLRATEVPPPLPPPGHEVGTLEPEPADKRPEGAFPPIGASPMPAVNYKVTFLFNAGPFGRSISLRLMDAPEELTEPMRRHVTTMAKALYSFMGAGVKCVGIRLSDVLVPQRTYLLKGPPLIQSVTLGPVVAPGAAYQVRLGDGLGKNRRVLQIPFMSSDLWTNGSITAGDFLPSTRCLAALGDLQKEMKGTYDDGSRWGLHTLLKDSGAFPKIPIASVEVDPTSKQWVLGLETSTLKLGDRLGVHGMKGTGLKGLNGQKQIVAVLPAGKYRINTVQCINCTPQPTMFGFAQQIGYTNTPIVFVENAGFGECKIGNAFFVPPGRRRGRCC